MQNFHFAKKVVSSVYAVYQNSLLQTFKLLLLVFLFIFMRAIYKTRIKRYADKGTPCLVPLSNLKYFFVCPPFTMHNFWFYNNNLIHYIKSFLNPYSKDFSMSTIIKILSICIKSVISAMSVISLPPWLINLLFEYAIWFSLII